MSFLKIFQRKKKLEPTKPYIDVEFGIDQEAIYKRLKLTPYYGEDDLLKRKRIEIFNEMLKDEEIESAINTLKTIRLSSGWTVEPVSDNPKDIEICDFVKWNFDNIEGSFDDDLREIMGALEMGVSLEEIVWQVQDKGKYKGKIVLKALKSKNPKYFNIWVDDFDNLRENAIVNISAFEYGATYPTEKFLIYSFNKRYENVFGTSRLRSIYDLWFLKQVLKRAWGIYAEKFAMPMPVVKHPPGIPNEIREKLLEMINQLRIETGLVIPKEIEISFERALTGAGNFFVESIDAINRQLRKTILGQTLTGEAGSVGSYALGKVHFDILLFYEEQLGRDIEQKVINSQLIPRLVNYNYEGVEEYPKFKFNPLIQENIIQIIDKYYQGVQTGILTKTDEDEDKIREYLKMPKRAKSSEEQQQITEKLTETKVKNKILVFQELNNDLEKIFTGVLRRRFTKYENGYIDFAETKTNIENIISKSVRKIATIIYDRALTSLGKQIEPLLKQKNFTLFNQIDLTQQDKQEIENVIKEALMQSKEFAMKQASKTIAKKSKIKRFQSLDLRNLNDDELNRFLVMKASYLTNYELDYIRNQVKQILLNSVKTGATLKDVMYEIERILERYIQQGVLDEEQLGRGRLETVVRTNLMEAYNESQRNVYENPDLENFVVAYQYSAVMDARVRPNHACLDGKIYSVKNAIWQTIYPPNGHNCRCVVIPITQYEEWEEDELPDLSVCGPDVGFHKPGLL